jgi:predicted KAP-like P-loop ATPase
LDKKAEEARKKLSDEYTSLYYNVFEELKKAVDEKEYRIVAFIDDLDRCLPEKAVDQLEANKTLLDLKGYLFVLGGFFCGDREGHPSPLRYLQTKKQSAVDMAVAVKPEDYLNKTIQIPLLLPPIEDTKQRDYIVSLFCDSDGFAQNE